MLELKAGVWRELQRRAATPQRASADNVHGRDPHKPAGAVEFQDIVRGLRPGDGGRVEDLSVHLCFICLLHLVNDHDLSIEGTEGLDGLRVGLTAAASS